MATVFFQGSINEAIQLSVVSRKPLVCFVTGEEEGGLSSVWEKDYFQDEEFAPVLNTQAVTIRLVAGSVEAGYLSAFCPVENVPTVLVIKNGTVAENISGDVEKTMFIQRISKAIKQDPSLQSNPVTTSAPSTTTQPPTSTSTLFAPDPSRASSRSPDAAARNAARIAAITQQTRDRIARLREMAPTSGTVSPSTESTVNTPPSDSEAAPSDLREEEGALRDVHRSNVSPENAPLTSSYNAAVDPTDETSSLETRSESSSKTPEPKPTSAGDEAKSMQAQIKERIARMKARKEEEEKELEKKREIQRRDGVKANQEAVDSAKSRSNAKYKEEQKKKREHEQSERKRILAQIEADKAERREREERRKAVEKSLAENAAEEERMATTIPFANESRAGNDSAECALSFRLLDGTSIRAKFPSSNTVGNEVRKWVDANRTDGDQPYSLTRLRPPQPAKKITSETESLQELNLTPNASLILVPLGGSRTVSAYAPPGTGWLMSFFLMIWTFIKTILGLGHVRPHALTQEEKQSNVMPESSSSGREGMESDTANDETKKDKGKRRVWTLHDDDTKRSAFYNGNQLDFEPRKDDDE